MVDVAHGLKFAVRHVNQDRTFSGSLWLDGVEVVSISGEYGLGSMTFCYILNTAEVRKKVCSVSEWMPVYGRAADVFDHGWEWPDTPGWWWSIRKEVWEAGSPTRQSDWTPVLVGDRLSGAGTQLEHRDGTVIRQGEMAGSWAWFPVSMTDYCLGLCPD